MDFLRKELNCAVVMPSLLAANHAHLLEDFEVLLRSNEVVPWIHFDVMDGHFVPNLSFGPQVLKDLISGLHQKKLSIPQIDVHLMVDQPERWIEPFSLAGANLLSVHGECPQHRKCFEQICERKILCGLALNPSTPLEPFLEDLKMVDLLLLMTVQPGFGGQSFREDVLPKIAQANAFRKRYGLNFRIEVDGGIQQKTISIANNAGADIFVAGSAIFGQSDPVKAYQSLLSAVR